MKEVRIACTSPENYFPLWVRLWALLMWNYTVIPETSLCKKYHHAFHTDFITSWNQHILLWKSWKVKNKMVNDIYPSWYLALFHLHQGTTHPFTLIQILEAMWKSTRTQRQHVTARAGIRTANLPIRMPTSKSTWTWRETWEIKFILDKDYPYVEKNAIFLLSDVKTACLIKCLQYIVLHCLLSENN